MSESSTLITLARWMSGEFDNQLQAREQPVWFVHLRLWYRPIPHRLNGHLALFAEQANALKLDQPYRQRVALLQEPEPGILQAQYLAFKSPDRFLGAGANPDRLKNLSLDDLEWLPGCVLSITTEGDRFIAKPPQGSKCCFQYDGKTRQVVLGFEVSRDRFWSYDRGVDPDTGQGLWGALMGAYEFGKVQEFEQELPE